MKYAKPGEIEAYFKQIDAREEAIRKSQQFGAAIDLTAQVLHDQGKSRDELTSEIGRAHV